MKKQVFFIHGGDAYTKYEDYLESLYKLPLTLPGEVSSQRWTKTLAEDLGEEYEVFSPVMPSKYNARYNEWLIWFERHFPYLRDGVELIGWSLGGMFLAKYLSENDLPVKVGRVFLLAAPCGTYDDGKGNDCGTFQFDPEILNNLNKKGLSIEIWHSEDDFVVPFEAAETYAKKLPSAKTVYFKDKNHFLVAELPELLETIKS
jgi:predicted alpha/beta hydrolase family esterase